MDALHPKRDPPQPEQKSPALADEQKQSTPPTERHQTSSSPGEEQQAHQKVKLRDVNSSLTCDLCKGYLIDATTISECLHSFCRSCIIKFLEENSFCPVCEVVINKAKPNLKLDKTLQDIVYKLVPGLFLSEMMRRRHFYADKPREARRVSPEQRGEDTERTIFNPQDRISLSLEYIGDAATTGLILKDLKQEQDEATDDAQAESLLKRYLQCPSMCRIDVIKKFIRNKYNVNTDLFQIDILYKRVPLPLPDHYTLVDVAYIYTWKRNEPMRFYFRIIDKGNDELPDLTKVFTPVDDAPFLHRPLALSTPNRSTKGSAKEKNRKTPKRGVAKKLPVAKPSKKDAICDKRTEDERGKKRRLSETDDDADVKIDAGERCDEGDGARKDEKVEASDAPRVKKETDVASDHCDNGKVYTNITLDRANNVEIVTKIQKLSDKDCQQIEVNIIDQSAKQKGDGSVPDVPTKVEVKTETSDTPNVAEVKEEPASETPKEEPSTSEDAAVETKPEPTLPKQKSPTPEVSSTTNDVLVEDEEMEKTKFEFLKSIELTAKKVVDNIARLVHQQQQNNAVLPPSSQPPELPKPNVDSKPKRPTLAAKPGSNGLKRKNSSPVKNEPSKRTKVEPKRTTKIILQQKPGYPPLNLAKPTEKPEDLTNHNRNELRSLFQTCRLNIPSSLSITLKENGETSRQPVHMPPVQNFIEILKIDEKAGTQTLTLKREESQKPSSSEATPNQLGTAMLKVEQPNKKGKEPTEKPTKEQQSFQKIFEESIKKVGSDANPDASNGPCKKKILDIAQQLYKRTRIEQDAKKSVAKPSPKHAAASTTPNPFATTQGSQKIAIPRLNNQRVVKPPKRSQKYDNSTHQTLTNLHSSSLGLNYTVSVGKQQPREAMTQKCSNGIMTPPSGVPRNGENQFKVLSGSGVDQTKSNAGLGGVFLGQPSPISPKTSDTKSGSNSPKTPKALHSPKPSIALPAPKTDQGCLPPPLSSPRNFSPQSSSKSRSPRPGSRNPSPKPRSGIPSPKPRPNSSPNPLPPASTSGPSSAATTNELLEKYNIQNLAQLSASMNFNAQAYLNSMSGKQMTALHQAMLMKQIELHNRQNWFNINQAPLLQYEKYLQNLNATNSQMMGNLKDN